jgi:hypothetical protein
MFGASALICSLYVYLLCDTCLHEPHYFDTWSCEVKLHLSACFFRTAANTSTGCGKRTRRNRRRRPFTGAGDRARRHAVHTVHCSVGHISITRCAHKGRKKREEQQNRRKTAGALQQEQELPGKKVRRKKRQLHTPKSRPKMDRYYADTSQRFFKPTRPFRSLGTQSTGALCTTTF